MVGHDIWVGSGLRISITAIGGNHLAEREHRFGVVFWLGLGSKANAKRSKRLQSRQYGVGVHNRGVGAYKITQSKAHKNAREKNPGLSGRSRVLYLYIRGLAWGGEAA